MAEKTELEIVAVNAALAADTALRELLSTPADSKNYTNNLKAAIHYIGQHAIALMKLAAEREHAALQRIVVEGRPAQSPNWVDRRSYQQQSPQPEYTEREIEMYARGRHAERYMTLASETRPWSDLSEAARKWRCDAAAKLLNPTAHPGEPR